MKNKVQWSKKHNGRVQLNVISYVAEIEEYSLRIDSYQGIAGKVCEWIVWDSEMNNVASGITYGVENAKKQAVEEVKE